MNPAGRISRRHYWLISVVAITALIILATPMEALAGRWAAVALFLPIFWLLYCLMAKRCHDVGRSSWWLILLIVPIVGIIWAVAVLGFRRGEAGSNQYGADPHRPAPDYLTVGAVS